jgi:hypothetical protein
VHARHQAGEARVVVNGSLVVLVVVTEVDVGVAAVWAAHQRSIQHVGVDSVCVQLGVVAANGDVRAAGGGPVVGAARVAVAKAGHVAPVGEVVAQHVPAARAGVRVCPAAQGQGDGRVLARTCLLAQVLQEQATQKASTTGAHELPTHPSPT